MRKLLTYVIALLMPFVASAQALPFVAADFSAGALARAGANATETSSTAFAAFGNVAAVPYAEKSLDCAIGYTSWQPSSAGLDVLLLGGSYNINDKMGFALGMTYGMHPEYEVFNEYGSSKGSFKPADIQVKGGFSMRFLPYLSAGVSVGYASSSLAESVSYGAFDADVFLMSEFSDYKVALGVSDLGSALVSATDVKFSLPSALVVGLGYEKTFAECHKLDIGFDADYYFAGAFAASAGAEYTLKEIVSFSAGYSYGGKSVLPTYASVGFGGCFYGVSLDLAYVIPVANSAMSNTLSLAVGYSF